MMNLIKEGASFIAEEEDRLSNLPDDITYHILSFMDMKYAIQTSMLSRKWRHIWTLMPQLNLNSDTSHSTYRFGKFVQQALSHRNTLSEVSTVKLFYRGSTTQFCVTDIIKYAYLRNLTQLNMTWSGGTQHELPRCLFSSNTLKHLTLANRAYLSRSTYTPNSVWDLPALETLKLTSIRFGDGSEKNLDLFSKCVNLKEITIHDCSMKGLESFDVCAPRLSSLTITESSIFPKVFKVVAPQLETLTASPTASACFEGLASPSNFLHLSTTGFNALEKVDISLSNIRYKKERNVPTLLELFRILHNVKFLTLDMDVIESLSLCLDQVSTEPCPFDNLKCLKISRKSHKPRDSIPTLPTEVRRYLLDNAPNATFIMESPQLASVHHTLRNGNTNSKPSQNHYLDSSSSDSSSLNDLRSHANYSTDDGWPVADEFRDVDSASIPSSSRPTKVPQKRPRLQVDSDTVTKKVAKFEVEEKLPRTMVEEKRMLEAKIQRQDQDISQQKSQIQKQYQVNGQQMTKIRNQDQVIAQQKAKIQMHDQIIEKYKTKFGEKIKEQDQLVAKQRETFEAKVRMQDQVIKKLKRTLAKRNSQHEKLILEIFKCKLAEMKVQVESGKPDYEVICSVGRDIKLAIDMIPTNLRANVEAKYSFQYEMLKRLLLTRIDASQWARFETALGDLRLSKGVHPGHGQTQSQSRVHAAEPHIAPPRLSPANMTMPSRVLSGASSKLGQPSQSFHV